jgi:hypothetical protein
MEEVGYTYFFHCVERERERGSFENMVSHVTQG